MPRGEGENERRDAFLKKTELDKKSIDVASQSENEEGKGSREMGSGRFVTDSPR